jgi:putative FmdB family regulatory protein
MCKFPFRGFRGFYVIIFSGKGETDKMPIYEFCCQDCREEFEEFFHSSSQKKDVVCAKCGSANVRKKVSLFGMAGKNGDSAPSSGGGCVNCVTHNCGNCH